MATDPMKREDVNVGLSVMQTVYTVAMVLGFKIALEKSYHLFISPFEEPSGQLPHLVLLVVLGSIMLLGLRFFWVIRNLYEYVLRPVDDMVKHMRAVTLRHFPITLLHALLFFAVCQAYVELVGSNATASSGQAVDLMTRLIYLFVGLLFVNGAWLALTFRPQPKIAKGHPEGVWAYSNLVCTALALIDVWLMLDVIEAPLIYLAISACVLFIANGLLDLYFAAESYILFPEGARSVADRPPGT